MSEGLIFLGGFATGGLTVFVVMHATVWLPRYHHLNDQYLYERVRRIEAEDNDQHGGALRASYTTAWGDGLPDTAPAVSARPDGGRDGRRPYEKPELINLTDIDDQFLMDTP